MAQALAGPQEKQADFGAQPHLGKSAPTMDEAPTFKTAQAAPEFSGGDKRVAAAQKDVKIKPKKIAGQGGDTELITERNDVSNVASGASAGATVGGVVSGGNPVGYVVGGVVGGILGGIAGLLS